MTRAREEYAMYEDYYGFVEKPFSLTPDPKYLYKSESHANAFELLQYGIRRREGFVVVTGDIGTGKTTLCRAMLEQLDRKTFTALVLNPFLAEDDLLRLILQDFGVVSRDEIKRGRLAGVSRQELIETLNDFLLSLLPLRATALLIIDEAQNLPRPVLEHIRMLSNLETDKEKLLQIVLVGQLNLKDVLRTPELRQLDQRVLDPLRPEAADRRGDGRLRGAPADDRRRRLGGELHAEGAAGACTAYTAGIPRLINLVCDRALLAALLGASPARHARHGALGRGQPRSRRPPFVDDGLAENAGGEDLLTCDVRRATCDVRRASRAMCSTWLSETPQSVTRRRSHVARF